MPNSLEAPVPRMTKVRLWVFFFTLSVACEAQNGRPFSSSYNQMGAISISGQTPGPNPFITFLQLSGSSLAQVTSIAYTLQPRPGSVSKPVTVSYTIAALRSRGYVTDSTLTVPVFGLYAGFDNQGTLQVGLDDESTETLPLEIVTPPYVDPYGIYDHTTILKARSPGSSLGFDFFAIKSAIDPVIIVDTDAAVRWIGTGTPSISVIFDNNGFVVGSPTSGQGQRVELDGTLTSWSVAEPTVVDFTHNIDPGKEGWLAEFDTTSGIDATVEEIGPSGATLHTWDMASLLSAYMASQGDDPTQFVRPGVDWFHVNASTYDPRDDSLIVSSRENFLIKVDYATGELLWILGDPTKYWYSFPSLKAKALQLVGGGLYPIGQHATSITSDGLLMVFNDGWPSVNQPAGAPAGASRPYSAVSAYSIDQASMTAQEVWDFDDGKALDSIICSSAYEAAEKSVLVDYAFADGGTDARLLGLDANHDVVFAFSYVNHTGCSTSWNAVPVPLDNIQFQ
jgi:arylsulfate sulfotransferase